MNYQTTRNAETILREKQNAREMVNNIKTKPHWKEHAMNQYLVEVWQRRENELMHELSAHLPTPDEQGEMAQPPHHHTTSLHSIYSANWSW